MVTIERGSIVLIKEGARGVPNVWWHKIGICQGLYDRYLDWYNIRLEGRGDTLEHVYIIVFATDLIIVKAP